MEKVTAGISTAPMSGKSTVAFQKPSKHQISTKKSKNVDSAR